MPGLITEFLGEGLAAARPATPDIPAGSIGLYYATDDAELSGYFDGAWVEDILAGGGGAGLVDGDYGDITVSGTGTVMNIDANAVGTTEIANSAVALAKIANAAANSKLLGSGASGSGSPYAELTLGTNLSMSGTTLNASGGDLGAIHCYEEQPSGTAGGGSTASTWVTRVLNTTASNSVSGASLSSNEIILPAGTYEIHARVPCFSSSNVGFKARLYNVTGAAVLIEGSSTWSNGQESECQVQGRFTLSGTSNVRVEMTASATRATNGFGVNSGITGVPNHFTDVLIRRVA